MSDSIQRITAVEETAAKLLGAKAAAWLERPNRQLARLSPRELAGTSEAGLRVVMTVLERYWPVDAMLLGFKEAENGGQGNEARG